MHRIVIITGASRGLGLSLAGKLLAIGDKVYGVSLTRRHWPKAIRSVPHSENFILKQCDLNSESQIKRLLRGIYRAEKRIDLIINNAGYGGKVSLLEKLSRKEWQKYLDSNLTSAFLVSKHAIPLMKKHKSGLIANISSMAGQRAVPKLFAYSAAKFGVLALSQCIAKEYGESGIRSFTVCPGGMNTEMRARLFGKKDAAAQQNTEFVADVILDVIRGKIKVDSGGDIVIRHGKITAIHPCPGI